MDKPLAVVWFRQDLRLHDNPALLEASKRFTILPLYVYEEEAKPEMGGASKLWLHYSLEKLCNALSNRLILLKGRAEKQIFSLIESLPIKAVFWNRCYEPWRIHRDKKIKKQLQEQGIEVDSFNASLLWEPWEILKEDSSPYKVFTPFYKKASLCSPETPIPSPTTLSLSPHKAPSLSLDELQLLPDKPWGNKILQQWKFGEKAALKRFDTFLSVGLSSYRKGRDFPSENSVSRLSPALHFGEISPRLLWETVSQLRQDENAQHFLRELGWREFSYHLLYHYPQLPDDNLQNSFDVFPWLKAPDRLRSWQKGLTGYPIVDAGMRELWQTGYMHNRVRMIVGSFLVKNLLISWKKGKEWFWDCLFDADLASNSASWQWVAGCGTDASPYFRIFNPITQGKKFDPTGSYTKSFVPELSALPDKYLFCPWEAPDHLLRQCGITLGKDYPYPIVELSSSRQEALAAYEKTKNKN